RAEVRGVLAPTLNVRVFRHLAAEWRQRLVFLLSRDLEVMSGHELVRDQRRREEQIALAQLRAVEVIRADRIGRRRDLVVAERRSLLELRIEPLHAVRRFRRAGEEARHLRLDAADVRYQPRRDLLRRLREETAVGLQEAAELGQRAAEADLLA